MIKAVLFDLDGTLLPMDQNAFQKTYFGALAKNFASLGYDGKAVVAGVMKGVHAMVHNDGTHTNEEAFWESMVHDFGEEIRRTEPTLDHYYRTEFADTRTHCTEQPLSKQTVELCHSLGLMTVLATNPLFPAIATQQRMSWVGLSPADFQLFTHYGNSSYCKPNPAYYLDIASRIGVAPQECLMVGNDVAEDMIAKEIGMQVFLIPDCLINTAEAPISDFPSGSFHDLMSFIQRNVTLC